MAETRTFDERDIFVDGKAVVAVVITAVSGLANLRCSKPAKSSGSEFEGFVR